MSAACEVCGKESKSRCSACKSVFYCGAEHQKEDWKAHKVVCGQKRDEKNSATGQFKNINSKIGSVNMPTAAQWAVGLSSTKQQEWLMDCYRMRIDDDYVWGGTNRGLYDFDATARSVVADFLLFCKLAVSSGVLPSEWDWKKFLHLANEALMYSFEKSDASEKYGSENVFAAAMGGRSLRYTAESVYGTSCQDGSKESAKRREIRKKIEQTQCFTTNTLSKHAGLFEEVGGHEVWQKLSNTFKLKSIK
jgi:hypothetical protein